MAYVSGYDEGARLQGPFSHLYHLAPGQREELTRWPIGGLCCEDQWGKLQKGVEGYEILEVVCIPGERPRRPKTLCGPRPYDEAAGAHYDGVKEHWYRQLRHSGPGRPELRVRRVGPDGEPAFYLNPATELDLPLGSIRGMQRRLPSFWRDVYRHYEQEANRSWPHYQQDEPEDRQRTYEVYPAAAMTEKERQNYFWQTTYDQHGRRTGKVRRERGTLVGALNDHRQFCWDPRVVGRFLSPLDIDSICHGGSQNGLWLRRWSTELERDSQEYQARLALWEAGLLRWDNEWSISVEQAAQDLQQRQRQQPAILETLLQTFLVQCCLRVVRQKTETEPPVPTEPLRLHSYHGVSDQTARGPPRYPTPLQ